MKHYEKKEIYNPETLAVVKKHYAEILTALGEDVTRAGLEKTPERVAKAMHFLTQGYELDALEILRGALFNGANYCRCYEQTNGRWVTSSAPCKV